ncbi:MAG: endonuclease Q family protein [Thaumarchaeota archaeon]|nr:endonuclease Q family protein [Candidatus Calditenuaceae archaeon]MDW8187379.1 endonuclease Q family protein [Nitrososphaerota archaeon]
MTLDELVYYADLKGINLMGTGDALHPLWLRELIENTSETAPGVYEYRGGGRVRFVTQTEVATVHEYAGKTRKIHHVILMPCLEVAEQLSDALKRYGNVESDGRPVLNVRPSELVDVVLQTDRRCYLFPAHAWTPWWSIFGAFSGVDSVEECYEDKSDRIHAIETGLSSDPPMNWRVSRLEKFLLISSSDSHSPYPYRIGREMVVLEVEELSYDSVHAALTRSSSASKVVMTVEVPPSYGKYHWSGHRRCGVGPLSPNDAKRLRYFCPKCGRRLTKGVEDRVEELADRPEGHRPARAIDFVYLLPLQELIALSRGYDPNSVNLMSRTIWTEYVRLISALGNEIKVLLEVPMETIAKLSDPMLARLIEFMRRNELTVIPGFDGVYGRVKFPTGLARSPKRKGTEPELKSGHSKTLDEYHC